MKLLKPVQRIAMVAMLLIVASGTAHAQLGGLVKKAKNAASKVKVTTSAPAGDTSGGTNAAMDDYNSNPENFYEWPRVREKLLADKVGGLANFYELNTPSGEVLLKYYVMSENVPTNADKALRNACIAAEGIMGIYHRIYGITQAKYAKQNPAAGIYQLDDTVARHIKYAETSNTPKRISKAEADALREQMKRARKMYIEFTGYQED